MFYDLARWCGRYVFEGLLSYGMIVSGFPGYDIAEDHPEQPAADVPMSATERELWAQLTDLR
ncbi:hypothetical protein GCM10010172_02880 [Paractinoplanes ferrugineus]|uniref:Uncharacterized protein n=1 Tax=Paractinoplanes ferrugineus TaxID=113564 RepID=A0A919J638_9ACTN|nr:DUF6059 family protein [Actinoplanes ferrugineus]GIE13693.1 hypothetical protein Afe05nite_55330 [Actinoplanes ferrugineus]